MGAARNRHRLGRAAEKEGRAQQNPGEEALNTHPVAARDKSLKVNLDPRYYGAFAEIGAGQEVVRWFFRAGGAAGTISKSISAYDMKVSDAIYGPCARYVCRERLQAMLDHEQQLNLERLAAQRGADTAFFAFADTVSARSFRGNNECHGWMGIKFQTQPGGADNQIIIHVRMLDVEKRAAAGSAGHRRRESRVRRVLPQRGTGTTGRIPARWPHDGSHRDRSHRVLRPRARPHRQSRDEPAARAARPHGRGDVLCRWRSAAAC
jgi:hypothetical protein